MKKYIIQERNTHSVVERRNFMKAVGGTVIPGIIASVGAREDPPKLTAEQAGIKDEIKDLLLKGKLEEAKSKLKIKI